MTATDGWKTELLGSIADVIDPHPSHRAPAESKEGIPFPGIGDFREDGSIDFSSCRIVDASVYDDHRNRYEVIEGTIGFGRVASIGKVIRLRTDLLPYAVSPTMAIIMPKAIDAGYLTHFLKGPQLTEQLAGLLTGTTRSSLGIELLRKLKVSFPEDEAEQGRIGKVLSTLDQAIVQTEEIIAKQQRIKTGLMQNLLTKGIDEHGIIRSEATHDFKDSPLGRIPVEWEVVTVEDLCSDIVDCPHTTPTYIPSGVPCIRTADMIPGQLLLDQAYGVTEEAYRERVSRLIPKKGDVIYSREGERLGIASPVGNERVCLGQRVMLLRPGLETDPNYLLWSMNSLPFYIRIITGLGATTSPHINVGDIRKALILKPSAYEQEKIGRMLATQHLYFRSVSDQIAKYEKMKTGLMHDLLTGTVRVN